jgi:hypothetical protein
MMHYILCAVAVSAESRWAIVVHLLPAQAHDHPKLSHKRPFSLLANIFIRSGTVHSLLFDMSHWHFCRHDSCSPHYRSQHFKQRAPCPDHALIRNLQHKPFDLVWIIV